MKAVILAGGLGTRCSEETHLKPKPMIEIGGKPVLWHILKFFDGHGVRDFVICLGYRGHQVKEFFANYFLHTSDVTIDLATNELQVDRKKAELWRQRSQVGTTNASSASAASLQTASRSMACLERKWSSAMPSTR